MDLLNPKKIYKEFKSDKIKNSNIIVDLLIELEGSDVKKLRKAIAIIHKIFCELIQDGDVKKTGQKKSNKNNPETNYDKWLYERYKESHSQLLKLALKADFPLQLREISFIAVIKFLHKEALHPITKEKIGKINFPIDRLSDMYKGILLSEVNCDSIIKRLKEYLQSPDFLYVTLYSLSHIISQNSKNENSPVFLQNVMSLLELINLPEEGANPLDKPNLFTSDTKEVTNNEEESETEEKFEYPFKEGKAHFNTIWESVLNMNFTPDIYKRCLVLLPDKVLMHLDQPVRLTDFFMNAYTLGGVLSLLAMHGIYVLITQYNLEYPDFYEKVYALLQPTIFQAKYKGKFFKLCNKFFLSPYLPEYIVAAFIKKMCRLMLTAPAPCIILLIKFATNLLLRFPSLIRLVNSPNATSLEDDPFLPEELNLLLCCAGDSSLWEIATVKQHPLYGISKAARFIERNLPEVESDLSKCIDDTYEDLYSRASKIRTAKVATTFHQPKELFKYSDDVMSSTWKII